MLWVSAALAAVAVVAVGRAIIARASAHRFERLLADAHAKLERLQHQFERFVPADVVERLTGAADDMIPERRRVTILFADLRGFTAMCNRLDPAVTVDILNDYFDRMIQAITHHHGHVTELVGDGLLALFGALEANPWQERDAVLAAQAMRCALQDYNTMLRTADRPELQFGIGIHSGEVVAGVIGTRGLSKFSVTGDPINVASRVEGLTSKFRVDLLVTEAIAAKLDDRFRLRPMPPAIVKGKAEPLQTFCVEPG